MELGYWLAFAATAVLVAATGWVGWSAAEWLWLQPRRLGCNLRAQGLRGSRYRIPYGDLKDITNLIGEARRKPLPLSHRIVDRVVPHLTRAVDLYGGKYKTSFFWLGPHPRVIIMDPELVKDILFSKFGHFEKPRPTPHGKLLALGVATYEGEKWARHRRILNPAFHLEKLKRMMPAFSACCDELISRWEDLTNNAGHVFEIDVWSAFKSFSGDIISRTAFGSSYKEGRRIFELQGEQTELSVQASRNLYIPGFRFIPTQKNRRRSEIFKEVVSLLKSMIKQRELAIKNGEAGTDDLLGLLMESNQSAKEGDDGHTVSLTTEDVIEECKLFYFAGHETTSVLLTWTMIVLSIHPYWQDQAREEVLHVFGQTKPTFEGLSRLKILTMIFYEVLRLYPPGIALIRHTYKQMKLGEFTFPPGVQLMLPIILFHHSREFWGEDAEEFNPKRFSEGVAKATKNQLIYFPFGWGPRICIGQNFALTEAKMAMARILQCFSFELSPSYAHAPCTIITLQPQHGAQVILHKFPPL